MANSFFAEAVDYWNAMQPDDLPTSDIFNFNNILPCQRWQKPSTTNPTDRPGITRVNPLAYYHKEGYQRVIQRGNEVIWYV